MPDQLRLSLLSVTACVLTLSIFAIDAFTSFDTAIAALYVIVVLVATLLWRRPVVIAVAAVCVALTVVAYLIGHLAEGVGLALVRCLVSITGIVVTAVLGLKLQEARQTVLEREAALRDASVRKDEFLAMLAHELRNPLAPISAAAHLLKMTSSSPEQIERISYIISRQVGHLSNLVDDLLDVSRVTRRLVVLNKEPVDMKRVIADAVEQVRPLIDERRHRLTIALAPESAVVLGDHKRLVQVAANLLNNAAKYTHPGGNVALAMETEGGTVVLRVSDDGIGIPAELLPRIFELFSQAERSADRSQGGLGIGLSLVKALVELHGGSVTAETAGPGAGSTFTVRLPLYARPGQANEAEVELPVRQAQNRLHILVVDDNADAAYMLGALLLNAGHRVNIVHGAKDALERAKKEAYDVFVLDIGMPELDGNQLAAQLRGGAEGRTALLLAVSGYGQASDREAALRAGFDHYLIKPVDIDALLDLLERFGERTARERDAGGKKSVT